MSYRILNTESSLKLRENLRDVIKSTPRNSDLRACVLARLLDVVSDEELRRAVTDVLELDPGIPDVCIPYDGSSCEVYSRITDDSSAHALFEVGGKLLLTGEDCELFGVEIVAGGYVHLSGRVVWEKTDN